jgi:hypothetical protein
VTDDGKVPASNYACAVAHARLAMNRERLYDDDEGDARRELLAGQVRGLLAVADEIRALSAVVAEAVEAVRDLDAEHSSLRALRRLSERRSPRPLI